VCVCERERETVCLCDSDDSEQHNVEHAPPTSRLSDQIAGF
jgi:hypothetical protein